ncbi:hypothetical protein MLD38_034300 [Melastoma candidum]|uniref:Uncharacterized protein n=1 Tax=Melastoma candidum TaxID=119954 RepID=A0ACB9MC39_9MYRT|nr:hypothetical protein MLD38_034300 [Melastoma candidum]
MEKVHSVAWNCSGTRLASSSVDQTVRVWKSTLTVMIILRTLWDARRGKWSQQIDWINRDDELKILDVQKFKPIHKRKFNCEVNEIAWNMSGELFFLTTGNGTREVLSYPSLRPLKTLSAHAADMLCVRTFTKLKWPVRSIRFNHTGEFIASAREDLFIDISNVQTGRTVHQIPCRAAMNSVEGNPSTMYLPMLVMRKITTRLMKCLQNHFLFESA